MSVKKWALVTGASAGFGLAIAEGLAAKGYSLILTARRRDRLEEISARLTDAFQVEIVPLSFDIRDRDATWKALSEAKEKVSRSEILVNNAGLAKGIEPLWEGKFEDWDQMMQTNVNGLLTVTRFVLPFMVERNSGHVVNVGSVAGRWTYPGGAVYAASKFAVRAISESLRMDLLGKKIRVTNIEPGMAETEFSEVRFGDPARAKKVYEGMTPLSAKDVADAVLWSLDRPPHVNIQEMVIFATDQAAIQMVHRKPVTT